MLGRERQTDRGERGREGQTDVVREGTRVGRTDGQVREKEGTGWTDRRSERRRKQDRRMWVSEEEEGAGGGMDRRMGRDGRGQWATVGQTDGQTDSREWVRSMGQGAGGQTDTVTHDRMGLGSEVLGGTDGRTCSAEWGWVKINGPGWTDRRTPSVNGPGDQMDRGGWTDGHHQPHQGEVGFKGLRWDRRTDALNRVRLG